MPTLIATCLICLAGNEESLDLIAETLNATAWDARVVDVLVRPEDLDGAESAGAFLARSHRRLLPSRDSADALWFRCQYGWTGPELEEIKRLLAHARDALRTQSADVALSGTRTTLHRDAVKVQDLIQRWNALHGPAPLGGRSTAAYVSA